MNRRSLYCVLALMAMLTIAQSAVAAEDEMSEGRERHLGGHAFMPSQYIHDPFVSTSYSTHVGAASAPSFTRDFHDLNGDLLFTVEGSIAFATLGMDYQQKLGEKWSIGLGGSGLVRTGTSALAFINDGANVNTNIDAWTKRLLSRSEKSQLTAGISWHYSTTTIFTPREFAEHLIDGGSLITAPFVSTGNTWDLQADLLWAHAFNATYGIRATGSFGVINPVGRGSELMGKNTIGLMGEVDFNDKHDFPLGITLGHFNGFPTNRVGSGLRGTIMGFWYTGKTDFIIGLESGWLEIPIDDNGKTVDGAFGSLNVKYYF